MKGKIRKYLWGLVSVAILVGTYIWASIGVFRVTHSQRIAQTQGKTVIRLAHSVADASIDRAFAQAAHDYQALNPDVKIEIQSIPTQAYMQWVNVQLIGGMSPDIIQTVSRGEQMWQTLATRYLLPLTNYVNEPNPWNRDTDLADTIWRDTYLDGMQGGYWFHLMQYYSIPMTIDSTRIFYNKELFREIFGDDSPPETFEQWMEMCQAIQSYAQQRQSPLVPIATANYGGSAMYGYFNSYFPMMTGGMIDPYDKGYSAVPQATFIVMGLVDGTFTLKNDRFRAAFELLGEIAQYFQPGFVGADIAQARLFFIQGNAAMIRGNVRDARVFRDNCDFEVGIFNYPMPSPDHPRYGPYVAGPVFESPVGQFHFGVAKNSPNRERAVDFMRFLTSRKINETFNKELIWYPVILDAEPHPFLEGFEPNVEGVYRYPLLWEGGGVKLWWDQNYPRYLTGEIEFAPFMERYETVWRTEGVRDFIRRDALYDRLLGQSEFGIATARSRKLFEEAGTLEAGDITGDCDSYQLGFEVLNLFEHGITHRRYEWHNLQQRLEE